jgi:hypothetical protein
MSLGEKEHFSLVKLGFSPRKIHCFSRKLYFSPRNFVYAMVNLLGTRTSSFFALRNYFLITINF